MKTFPVPSQTPPLDKSGAFVLVWSRFFKALGDFVTAADGVKGNPSARWITVGQTVEIQIPSATTTRTIDLPQIPDQNQTLIGLLGSTLVPVPVVAGSKTIAVPANTSVWGSYFYKEPI